MYIYIVGLGAKKKQKCKLRPSWLCGLRFLDSKDKLTTLANFWDHISIVSFALPFISVYYVTKDPEVSIKGCIFDLKTLNGPQNHEKDNKQNIFLTIKKQVDLLEQ